MRRSLIAAAAAAFLAGTAMPAAADDLIESWNVEGWEGGAAALPCGPGSWLPVSVTRAVPVAGSSASVEFPIPCMSSLVGAQFDVQWTTIDFPQAPCPTFPGLVLSDRMRMTLGP